MAPSECSAPSGSAKATCAPRGAGGVPTASILAQCGAAASSPARPAGPESVRRMCSALEHLPSSAQPPKTNSHSSRGWTTHEWR